MQETIQKPREDASVRAALFDVPLQMCFENLFPVAARDSYQGEVTLRVGDVAFVKNAP